MHFICTVYIEPLYIPCLGVHHLLHLLVQTEWLSHLCVGFCLYWFLILGSGRSLLLVVKRCSLPLGSGLESIGYSEGLVNCAFQRY